MTIPAEGGPVEPRSQAQVVEYLSRLEDHIEESGSSWESYVEDTIANVDLNLGNAYAASIWNPVGIDVDMLQGHEIQLKFTYDALKALAEQASSEGDWNAELRLEAARHMLDYEEHLDRYEVGVATSPFGMHVLHILSLRDSLAQTIDNSKNKEE